MKICTGSLAVLALTAAAAAQPGTGGTITDANASFTQGDSPTVLTSTGPVADFSVGGAGNPDHLFQSWWWGRLATDPREAALNSASSAVWSGSQGRVEYVTATNRIIQTSRVVGFGGVGGMLIENGVIINTSASVQRWEVFHYLDLDLGGSSGGDSATLNGSAIRVTDGDWVADYEGSDTYQVGAFASVRNLLTNATPDMFSNAGLPFAAGDWSGGYQWSFSLNPGEAVGFTAAVTIVPAPATGVLLALGLLARRRRR